MKFVDINIDEKNNTFEIKAIKVKGNSLIETTFRKECGLNFRKTVKKIINEI